MSATSAPEAPAASSDWLLEDFERAEGRSGTLWLEFDKNGLGTQAAPAPFLPEPGGAVGSPGAAAHIHGSLGANKAPWSWVQLQVYLNRDKTPQDLSGYKSLRFFVKGNGGRYAVVLQRKAITDYDHYRFEFTAPSELDRSGGAVQRAQATGLGQGRSGALRRRQLHLVLRPPSSTSRSTFRSTTWCCRRRSRS
ncbi:MAG: hypothetical protein QM756_47285 [Polyangiaceae bacterium]